VNASVPDGDALLALLRQTLEQHFEIDEALVVPSARLKEDLDLDSIDAVDLTLELNRVTGRKLDVAIFRQARTVGDVLSAVQAALAAAA
jgi:acyl carrier protein